MIKVLDSSLNTLAILENVVSPIISEEINREFTFSFTSVIDNNKSNYINYQNIIEIEDNYFNIVYTEEERTQDGIFINAQCEHVSYDLITANFTSGFTATGLFSAVATTLLSGTGFSVGTNEITASETISVNESTNARQLLFQLASLYNGELEFNKYTINLLARRGADRGVQFRYRKNLLGVKRIVDNRKKVGGLPTISYSVNVAELEFEQGFISDELENLEHYELGDTIKVIDEDLNLETSLRIVKESHDPEQRMQGTVEISNFVEDLTDTLTQIQTTSVSKDNIYNGCSIGPENGFVAERSDELVQTSMNATSGIAIDMRNTATASYTSVFYVQTDTATGTVNLYLVGNAVFTGTVEASDIIGGTITIGSGSNTFNANGTNGIWLGATAFETAPFSSTLSGAVTADNLLLTGGLFNIGTGTNTMQFNTTDGLFLGSTSASTAPFKATMSGALTATNAEIEGTISSSIVEGSLYRSQLSPTSERLEIQAAGTKIYGFDSANNSVSTIDVNFGVGGYGLQIWNILGDMDIFSFNDLDIGAGGNVLPTGTWNFTGTTLSNVITNTVSDHTHTVTIGTANYTTSSAGGHSHTVESS